MINLREQLHLVQENENQRQEGNHFLKKEVQVYNF